MRLKRNRIVVYYIKGSLNGMLSWLNSSLIYYIKGIRTYII